MKPIISALLVGSMMASSALSQQPKQSAEQTVIDQPGKIVFYRRGGLIGSAIGCPIRFKGEQIVELGRSKAFEWQVRSGRYILENKTSSVEVSVEPGETRYVRCQMKSGFIASRADLQIVDGSEYAEIKGQLEAPGT